MLIVLVAVAGLLALPADPPANASVPHPVAPLVRTATSPAADPGGAGMMNDERSAVHAVNQFWARHFGEYFNRRYQPPRVIGGYTSARGGPRCGPAAAQAFNAFYCKPDDFIAWDQALMNAGYQKIGNTWVYLIIAHEWGHAIQARVSRSLVSQADELQADCLGAAALAGAERDGTLRPEPGDAEGVAQTLAVAADKYPWTSNRDHGNAQQRATAYRLGKTRGVRACMENIR